MGAINYIICSALEIPEKMHIRYQLAFLNPRVTIIISLEKNSLLSKEGTSRKKILYCALEQYIFAVFVFLFTNSEFVIVKYDRYGIILRLRKANYSYYPVLFCIDLHKSLEEKVCWDITFESSKTSYNKMAGKCKKGIKM